MKMSGNDTIYIYNGFYSVASDVRNMFSKKTINKNNKNIWRKI